MRILALTLLVSLCVGCHRSGTWNDNPKNWERAFGQKPPKDLKIVHSQYWRSPHFTLEFEYFFEFAPSDTFRKEFTAYPRLQKFNPSTKEEQDATLGGTRPSAGVIQPLSGLRMTCDDHPG